VITWHYTGQGADRGSITFPVDGAEGFNGIAFEIYCEHDNGGSLVVSIRQKTEGEGKAARYKAVLRMGHFIDGWTPVRLVRDGALVFKQDGGVEPDWGKIRTVSLSLAGQMKGKGVYYLDNLRFENVSGGKTAPNMLYNSSFEIATNPDVPDGWTRDLAEPPHGQEVWGIAADAAFHGSRSLRIAAAGKYARSWGRHTRIVVGRDYTFSVYLKSDRPGVKAELSLQGLGKKAVAATTEWQRWSLTGKAQRPDTAAYVFLRSEGVLWVDAAQLELGASPTAYAPSPADSVKQEDMVAKKQTLAGAEGSALRTPTVRVRRASQPPALDGDLSDACWREAAEMTPFMKLKEEALARRKTVAKMSFDDEALYFAVRAEEPDMAAMSAVLEKSTKGPWGTDLIEIFIDLNHDRDTYYHFAANSLGQQWHARHTLKKFFADRSSSWRCEWQSAGKTDAGGWTVEFRIPYDCFDLRPEIVVGDVVGVNVGREDPRSKEHSSWAFSHGSFHTPQAFGRASGFAADLQPYRFAVRGLAWRRGDVSANIANHTGTDQTVKVDFVTVAPGGTSRTVSVRTPSPTGKDVAASASLPLREEGRHSVVARVVDATGRVRCASQPVYVRVSGAAVMDLVGTELDFYTTEAEARIRCFVEADAERCTRLRLRWRLEREGRGLGEERELQPGPGVNEWSVPIAGAANGAYAVKVALYEDGKQLAEGKNLFRKLPPARHEVRLNRWGRFLVCDGRPFFWYGFYDNLGRGSDQRWVDALQDMQGANCNCVLNYVGTRTNYDRVGWALDQAQARGIKVWVHLGWMLSWWIPKYKGSSDRYENDQAALAHLREVVTNNKEHPALLGWCTLDEPGNRPTMFTTEYTEKYYRLVKELDPHHPCIFSHLTRLGEVDVYGGATDLALMPFHARDGRFETIFWEFWDAGLPVAVNPPCFGALGGSVREPTPAEQRIRVYKALILGARGACSYTYRCASVQTWREWGRIGAELKTLAPVLLTPDDRLRVDVTPGAPDVYAVLKARGAKFVLIAVNVAPDPVKAAFRLLDAPGLSKATPLFETKPAERIDAGGKTLHATIAGRSTAVFEIE